ncbi:MAG: peptidoglycan -binding protein, partial [Halocynthiibacter sp.]
AAGIEIETLGGAAAERAATEAQLRAALAVAAGKIEALGEVGAEKTALEAQLRAALAARLQAENSAETARALAEERSRALTAPLAAALAARQAAEAAEVASVSDADQRSRLLADALAARLAASNEAEEARSEAERQALLLAVANSTLRNEEVRSTESQRQLALLNEQVAALRTQLGALQALLDDASSRDSVANVQIESLGSQLNTALARAVAEERRRRQLEEAERRRLEAEALVLQAKAQDLESYRSEFFGLLREVLGGQEGVRIDGDRFVFASEVLFSPGDVTLSDAGRAEVAKVARIILDVADEIPPELDWVIRVDGHTDNVPLSGGGRYRDNWELSQGRALSVVRYMIDELGLPPNRLAATGFGEFQPVNSADTPEARAQDRRIELKLTER